MKLTKLFRKIISKEPYNDMNIFFSGFESFEEIPLISRRHRLKLLKKNMEDEKVSDLLVGFSFFLLNSIKAMSRTEEHSQIFFAITFVDFDLFAEEAILMPNIFVYPAPGSSDFLAKIKARRKDYVSKEMNEVKKYFSRCNIESIFEFFESRFQDSASNEDIIRVYAVPKTFSQKIERISP